MRQTPQRVSARVKVALLMSSDEQFGGSSNSGLPMAPEGVGGWRCLAVEKLSRIEFCADAWHTEPQSPWQTCVDAIDFDADARLKKIRSRGNEASARRVDAILQSMRQICCVRICNAHGNRHT